MSRARRRPLCLLWPEPCLRLAHSVEGPLFWGVWQDLRQAFLHVSGGRLTGQPWDRPRDRVGRWSRGARVCVVCVLSVRIYAKGAALPVRLQVVEAQRPVPPDYAGHRMWGWRARPGAGTVECSSSKYLLNTSCWAANFPSCPQLLEQKSLGALFSPASGRS